jgi:hypothetical protein
MPTTSCAPHFNGEAHPGQEWLVVNTGQTKSDWKSQAMAPSWKAGSGEQLSTRGRLAAPARFPPHCMFHPSRCSGTPCERRTSLSDVSWDLGSLSITYCYRDRPSLRSQSSSLRNSAFRHIQKTAGPGPSCRLVPSRVLRYNRGTRCTIGQVRLEKGPGRCGRPDSYRVADKSRSHPPR